jgi:hypothetical protein
MIRYDIEADDLRKAIATLSEVEPKSALMLKRDLKATANQMASYIQTNISAIRPLSGMNGQTARALTWSGAQAIASYSITGDRRRDVTSLFSIKVSSKTAGYIVMEFAGNPNAKTRVATAPVWKDKSSRTVFGGSKPGGPQGAHLIAYMVQRFGPLKGKGGNRIAWKMFIRQQDSLNKAAVRVLDEFMARVSNEIGS